MFNEATYFYQRKEVVFEVGRRSISRNVASLDILIHNVMNLLC